MKKLSEVCELCGVNRRTLQKYASNEINLLKPTCKNEVGYWLYDDAAIQKLILIQIFRAAGYERKAIKAILELPTLGIIKEFDHLIANLEEKRKRIDGMINTIKINKGVAELPENTLSMLANLEILRIYDKKSFKDYFEDSINLFAENIEDDNAELVKYTIFCYQIIAIGGLMEMAEDTEQVQTTVEQTFNYMKENIEDDANNPDEEWTEAELAEVLLKIIQDLLNEPEFIQIVEAICGEGAKEYIIRAVQVFVERKKSI